MDNYTLNSVFDGVDSDKFKFYNYNDDIYTKDILVVGWVGNSDLKMHGGVKRFNQLKEILDGMKDKFIFKPADRITNYIPHDEIPLYYRSVDIIVCFSKCEGTPNQILEASSSGRAFISTDVGIVSSLNSTIDPIKNPCGIIIDNLLENEQIENEQKEGLIKALNELYNNRQLIVEMGQNGRKCVEQEWSWNIKVKQFYDLFNSIL